MIMIRIFVTLILSVMAVSTSWTETLTVVDRRFYVLDSLSYCPSMAAVKLGGDTLIHASRS